MKNSLYQQMFSKQISVIAWRILQCSLTKNAKLYSTVAVNSSPSAAISGARSTNKFDCNHSKFALPPGFRITYCYTEEECDYICEKRLSTVTLPAIAGCDAEWVPFLAKEKLAVLQLCVSNEECYVFHLSKIGHMPKSLENIIFNRWFVKVGIGIKFDLEKLSKDYCSSMKLDSSSYIDVGKYANDIGYCRVNNKNWSLQMLAKKVLKYQITKDSSIQLGNWKQFPLTDAQLVYAATDAYASLLLFKSLDNLRRQQDAPLCSYQYLAKKLKS